MTIDNPRIEDIPALRYLWREAFAEDKSFLDHFFATAFSPDRCRCVTLYGRIVAALYWFDCQWEDRPLAYIYAVATEKAFRGRGLGHSLMTDTQRYLLSRGYRGTALVPATKNLFSFYEKSGYRPFSYMDTVTVEASAVPATLTRLSKEDFCARRRQLLPPGGILQEGATVDFLDRFTEFYSAQDSVMCVFRDGEKAYFQEYLGDRKALPGILAALKVKQAEVKLPGSSPCAMYYSPEEECPGYLGLSLG